MLTSENRTSYCQELSFGFIRLWNDGVLVGRAELRKTGFVKGTTITG